MALTEKYKCNKCDFVYETKDYIFYFNRYLTEIIEEPVNKKSLDNAGKSPISGRIDEGYCRECKEFVKIYLISNNDNYTSLTNEEIREKIVELNDDKNIRVYFFQDERNRQNNEDLCGKCEKVLEWLYPESLCPKCEEGKLMLK